MPNREKKLARARMIAMHFYYNTVNPSNSEIGRKFNRHPSTVLHAIRKIDQNFEEYYSDLKAIRAML